MGAAMGADSPQAQEDPFAIAFCYLFLTFPIVCLACGILSPIFYYCKCNILSVVFGIFPIAEALTVIGCLLIFGKD